MWSKTSPPCQCQHWYCSGESRQAASTDFGDQCCFTFAILFSQIFTDGKLGAELSMALFSTNSQQLFDLVLTSQHVLL
jgi:hypothetical protein